MNVHDKNPNYFLPITNPRFQQIKTFIVTKVHQVASLIFAIIAFVKHCFTSLFGRTSTIELNPNPAAEETQPVELLEKQTLIYSNGITYVGQVKNGKKHGFGILEKKNDTPGEASNVDSNPYGSMKDAGEWSYTGNWKEDKRHGLGKMQYADGSVYTGEWSEHERHGGGTMTYADKRTYVGPWENHQMEGFGTMIYPDGTKESGVWKNGVLTLA